MKKQSGFTLIELIMVIVILGVLSAFALPRFADLGTEARVANLKGLAGALKSAANIAHAKQLVAGTASGGDVTLDGVDIKMVAGYPQAHKDGIVKAAGVSDKDYTISAGNVGAEKTITFTLKTNCKVDYTSAGASKPIIVLVTSTSC